MKKAAAGARGRLSMEGEGEKKLSVHLVSDYTGEALNAYLKCIMGNYERSTRKQIQDRQHVLIRSKDRASKAISAILEDPGPVFYTIRLPHIRTYMEEAFSKNGLPHSSIMDAGVEFLSAALKRHELAPQDVDAAKRSETLRLLKEIKALLEGARAYDEPNAGGDNRALIAAPQEELDKIRRDIDLLQVLNKDHLRHRVYMSVQAQEMAKTAHGLDAMKTTYLNKIAETAAQGTVIAASALTGLLLAKLFELVELLTRVPLP